MRAREMRKKDRETRALLVLDVVEKALKASGETHEKLKVTNDLLIQVADDVLKAPSK
jgi:Flp pilus assembly protein TadD